jgi:hypothetical protein
MLGYDCPLPVSGRFACRSLPDTWSASSSLCSSRLVARGESSHPTPGLLVSRYPSSSGVGDKETAGSLQFPNYPCKCMPRSQTPVVSHPLGLTGLGLLPSGRCKPSAFPLGFLKRLSCFGPQLYSFRGSIPRPALSLHPAPYLPSRERMRVRY